MLQSNPRLELAAQYVQFTNSHVFLTGKAGTGKTTFLKNLKHLTPKRIAIVAPTGVAAINAGGVTIHSFFQLPFGPHLPNQTESRPERRFGQEKLKAIKAVDLLVIDEISMVRADVLDAIDEVLRRFRNRNKPFGGVQLLMIGDLHQLAPVAKEEEWNLLSPYYPSIYFFESIALKKSQLITIELTKIFRQEDEHFIALLNKVRDKKLDNEAIQLLNTRYKPNFEPKTGDDFITLTTHNYAAQAINQRKLKELSAQIFTFEATVTGEFSEQLYPNDFTLELKIGTQIMFIKNDTSQDKRYFNGKLGVITNIDTEKIQVRCQDDVEEIIVNRESWDNIKYVLDANKQLQEDIIGSFTQYPIKAAWAITIHKSQGLTFERAIIDAQQSFAHGQVYVALSRCKTFEGLVLSSPIGSTSVKSDSLILTFDQEAAKQDLSENALNEAKKLTQIEWIRELFEPKAIKVNLSYLLKTIEPVQQQLATQTLPNLVAINNQYEQEIGSVLYKFLLQLETYLAQTGLPQENAMLQERIKKGSVYLYQKLEELVYRPLMVLDLACDNQETQKNLLKAWETSLKITFEKLNAFKICQNGFDATAYLQAKTNAALDFEVEKTRKRATKASEYSTEDNDLYRILKNWRDEIADEEGIERYMVLPQKTIKSLSEELPGSMTALSKIGGLGKIKLTQYGEEILGIITAYCTQRGLTLREQIADRKDRTPEKGSTQALSFDLFKSGKTIAEIAEVRQLTPSTIEGHLSDYVGRGELAIEALMDANRVALIKQFIKQNPTLKNKELIEAFDGTLSYGEIRMVFASMKQESTTKL